MYFFSEPFVVDFSRADRKESWVWLLSWQYVHILCVRVLLVRELPAAISFTISRNILTLCHSPWQFIVTSNRSTFASFVFFFFELCAEEKQTSFKIRFNSYKLTQLSLIICYRLFLSMCCRLQERKKFLNRIYYVLNGAAWIMRCDAIMVIYNPSEFFSIHTFAVTLPKFVEPLWIWYIGRPPNLIILEFKYSTEAGTHQSYFFICLFARSVCPQ